MNVRDIMTSPVHTVRGDDSVEHVAHVMLEHNIGGVPVVDDDDAVIGFITESAFAGKTRTVPFSTFQHPSVFGEWIGKEGLEKIHQKARDMRAKEIMKEPVTTATPDESVERLVSRMLEHDVDRVPVVENDRLVGIVTRHDLLRMMVGGGPD